MLACVQSGTAPSRWWPFMVELVELLKGSQGAPELLGTYFEKVWSIVIRSCSPGFNVVVSHSFLETAVSVSGQPWWWP